MIVAELCGNHCGDRGLLKEMVDAVAEAGATHAKIQTFFANDLTQEFKRDQFDRIKKAELDWVTHKDFVDWCVKANITPMTTVYNYTHADRLLKAGFKHIKIGSPHAQDQTLIKRILLSGFKVWLSTGGQDLNKLLTIVPLECVFHCVSKYPHAPNEANLSRGLLIKKKFSSSPWGFSDHTDPTHPEWDKPSKLALAMGAGFIERHFTILDRSKTKDGNVSIDLSQLKELVRYSKLSLKEKLSENPEFGLFYCDQTDKELIARYARRFQTKSK